LELIANPFLFSNKSVQRYVYPTTFPSLNLLIYLLWAQQKFSETNSGHLVHTTSAKIVTTCLKRVLCECDAKHRPPKQLEKLATTPILVRARLHALQTLFSPVYNQAKRLKKISALRPPNVWIQCKMNPPIHIFAETTQNWGWIRP
jgi:hypothetical protein